MKKLSLTAILSACLAGCTVGFWEDAFSKSSRQRTYDRMFADSVQDDINAELRSERPWKSATWQEFWIKRCEAVYNTPEMGDRDVEYVIQKRRAAGLPDIPELNDRQFRSSWQSFTDGVDEDIKREQRGEPAEVFFYGTDRATTWAGYWRLREQMAMVNPRIAERGVEYIRAQRAAAGLQPYSQNPKKINDP